MGRWLGDPFLGTMWRIWTLIFLIRNGSELTAAWIEFFPWIHVSFPPRWQGCLILHQRLPLFWKASKVRERQRMGQSSPAFVLWTCQKPLHSVFQADWIHRSQRFGLSKSRVLRTPNSNGLSSLFPLNLPFTVVGMPRFRQTRLVPLTMCLVALRWCVVVCPPESPFVKFDGTALWSLKDVD